jgi:4-carboxymuconolactone decarboxylase
MSRVAPAELPDDLPVHNNLVRATFRNPDLHRGFASLSGRVHSTSHLEDRTRELVVLCIAGMLGADYERQQHEPAARRVGVTEAEIAALRRHQLDGFAGADRAALELASAVEDCRVDDDVWRVARQYLSEVEAVDLVMLAGFYGLASRFVLALDVDLEGSSAAAPSDRSVRSGGTERGDR